MATPKVFMMRSSTSDVLAAKVAENVQDHVSPVLIIREIDKRKQIDPAIQYPVKIKDQRRESEI